MQDDFTPQQGATPNQPNMNPGMPGQNQQPLQPPTGQHTSPDFSATPQPQPNDITPQPTPEAHDPVVTNPTLSQNPHGMDDASTMAPQQQPPALNDQPQPQNNMPDLSAMPSGMGQAPQQQEAPVTSQQTGNPLAAVTPTNQPTGPMPMSPGSETQAQDPSTQGNLMPPSPAAQQPNLSPAPSTGKKALVVVGMILAVVLLIALAVIILL
jgi:hypothetical protein